jgi:4-hydroxy-tetrahydrodipicolinate synthase
MAAALAGDMKKALALQDKLVPLDQAIFLEPGVAGSKCGLSILGRVKNEVRLPLVTVTSQTETAIRAAMVHAGLINA